MLGAPSEIYRICLLRWRFEDEPQHHCGDPERDRADPHPNQCFPPLVLRFAPWRSVRRQTSVPRRTPQEARSLRQELFRRWPRGGYGCSVCGWLAQCAL